MQDEYTELRAGDRLRASIALRGSTVAAFARANGIPYRSLQDYVLGKSKPGFEQMVKLAEAGLDVGYILTGFPTGGVDHPSPMEIDPLELGDGLSMPGRHYLKEAINDTTAKAAAGLTLQEWVNAWSAAEREVPSFDGTIDPIRRQAATFALAADIALGVSQRLRALGLI